MGLLDRFRPDVSEAWPPASVHPLTWDVQSGTIEGVALGADVRMLEVLGRPDNPRPVLHNRFVYYQLGFVVELERGQVDYMGCIFEDLEDQGFASCRLSLASEDGPLLAVGIGSDPHHVLALLGEPDEVDRDPDETVYTYRRSSYRVELELTSASRLARVNLFRT